MVLTLLILLLLAPQAEADWSVTITGPVTISGPGAGPIVVPPVVPLPPPPVVPPITDTSPFAWPPAGLSCTTDDPTARYFDLCPNDGGCYTSLPQYCNPLPGRNRFACVLPMGMTWRKTQSIGGFPLWVPVDLAPAKIRFLCAGGAL